MCGGQKCGFFNCSLSCDKTKKCDQLRSWSNVCTATCDTGVDVCSQKCVNCKKNCRLICSAKKFHQVCDRENCTAICTSDVEECTQECIHSDCSAVSCNAKKCFNSTSTTAPPPNPTSPTSKPTRNSSWCFDKRYGIILIVQFFV